MEIEKGAMLVAWQGKGKEGGAENYRSPVIKAQRVFPEGSIQPRKTKEGSFLLPGSGQPHSHYLHTRITFSSSGFRHQLLELFSGFRNFAPQDQ